jgi:DNA-directed RNA polymerase subunit L
MKQSQNGDIFINSWDVCITRCTMEFIVIEETKTRLQAEIKGADHTICNAVVDELWNDKDVVIAAYNIEHPLTASPKIVIEAKGKEPRKALQDAITRVRKSFADVAKQSQKAL